ncbi:MAG: hypothetical protein HY286_09520 [Planctomycetes bacterium]|nr:hypothetical protein [Planctomycetota bacterium]
MLHRDNASHPERGASYVSVWWPIVFGLMFLVAVVMAWVQADKATKTDARNVQLESDKKIAENRTLDVQTKTRAFAEKTGYKKDADGVVEAVDADIADIKKALGKDAPATGTIQDLMQVVLKLAQQRAEAVTQRDGDLKKKDDQIASLNGDVKTTRDGLQKQLDQANSDARDKQSSDASRIQNLEAQVTQKDSAAQESQKNLAAATEKHDKEIADINKKYNLVEAKNADLNTKLAFLRAPSTPKGRIVDASDALPIAYIDIGERDRVVGGMRFEVCDYDNNRRLRSKGFCEVTSVEGSMSRVRLETIDKNNPIGKDDVILNPLFDPKGERRAVLVGRFPLASGGKKGVEQKLGDLGIKIAAAVDQSIDYLIVGDPEYTNTGDKQDLDSDPQVVAAAKLGTLRYSLRELEGFFRR